MADIFVSYARADKARVAPLVAALEAQGWSVWWDPEITPGQEFDGQISAALDAAKAVVVVWTPTSVDSRWVRGEAREAADRGVLAPVRFEMARLPIDARAMHTTDFDDWELDPKSRPFQDLARALRNLIDGGPSAAAPGGESTAAPAPRGVCICVLPFANMSGDSEQEYFADGISEDIITDLSKVSALSVIARNTAFTFKGKHVDVPLVARQLKVSHVLEGSVRKSGERVRITAQLIDGSTGSHVWAERYDRDLNDIFALQDEISEAIVAALKLRLLPEEKQAIEQRGVTSPEAYDLYLMARQYSVTGNLGNARRSDAIIRLCQRAVEIDPDFARAWALMAGAQGVLRMHIGRGGDGGRAAADQALKLDPTLSEAHAAKARVLSLEARYDEASTEVEAALRLDPDSYEANVAAAEWNYRTRRFPDAIRYYEKAVALMESDYMAAGLVSSCYKAIGDQTGARRAAQRALARTEPIVAAEPDNGSAMSFFIGALAALGEAERAKAAARRATLLDPDNLNLQYNIACTLIVDLNELEAALDVLETTFGKVRMDAVTWAKTDPDFDAVREHPRFKAMIASAEARLASS